MFPIGAITKGSAGEELAAIGVDEGGGGGGDLGRRASGDERAGDAAGDGVRAQSYDLPMIQHCEDLHLSAGGDMHEGARIGAAGAARDSGLLGRRDGGARLLLAELTGARYHVAHISSRQRGGDGGVREGARAWR